MGQFKDITIKEVIEEINVSYFLPDIQREYVWLDRVAEKKIEQLFDSILRNYPIGSFLFWKLRKTDVETDKSALSDSDKLNFQLYQFIEDYDVRNPHNEKIDIAKVNSNDLNIVLDGQQRLTSLYIGLNGSRTLKKPKGWWDNPNAFELKKLYLNLRYQPNEEDTEDCYQFEFKSPTQIPFPDENNFWFKVGDILNLTSLNRYCRENELDDMEADILEKLKNVICTERLISYFEETEKNLDKVLKIFIRVNSGGTTLSYSDLLMSILTANFSSDIRGEMNVYVDKFRTTGFGCFGRDQILKTSLLLIGANHIFNLKNFNKTNIHSIEQNWEKIVTSITDAVRIVEDFGYSGQLASGYIISIIALYLYRNDIVYNKLGTVTSWCSARRAISRRTGSKPDRMIASGVSSTMISMPVAASRARMFRPSRPMIRPFTSSLSMLNTVTEFSMAASVATRWIVCTTIFFASLLALILASSITSLT